MIKVFALVLNMSISASCAVMIVLALRLFFKRVPKIFSYLLWLAVFLRFLIPVAWETSFGIIPALSVVQVRESYSHSYSMHTYTPFGSEDSGRQDGVSGQDSLAEPDGLSGENSFAGQDGLIQTGNISGEESLYSGEELYTEEIVYLPNEEIEETEYIIEDENAVRTEISIPGISVEVPARIMWILAFVWCIVGALLIVYQVISYGIFMGKLHRESGNGNKEAEKGRRFYTWSSAVVRTPFVGGIFCPVVYLPDDLDQTQRELILEHEKIHIKRLDYLIKPIAMLICCIYWFNPFAWLAFYLMERDMESSCDEAVLRKIGFDRKKEYAHTLLGIAERDGWKPGRPIAFGENNVKNRIKRTVKLKKAKLGTVVIGVVVTLLTIVLLLVNRSEPQDSQEEAEVIVLPGESDASELPEGQENSKSEEQSELAIKDDRQPGNDNDEAALAGVQGTDSNSATELVNTMEAPHEEAGDREQNADDVSYRDHFEDILLTVDAPVNEVEIFYDYPVVYTYISDSFGTRIHPVTEEETFHSGVDFAADKGTAVTAAADGKVVKTGYDAENGNYIIVQHINGDMTYYAMCEMIVASEGDEVKRGEQIATVGSTGKSTGPHLHFAVSRDGSYIEPQFAESVKE